MIDVLIDWLEASSQLSTPSPAPPLYSTSMLLDMALLHPAKTKCNVLPAVTGETASK